MNVYLANILQFAIAHGVVLGIAVVSLASVIQICFKEMRQDNVNPLRQPKQLVDRHKQILTSNPQSLPKNHGNDLQCLGRPQTEAGGPPVTMNESRCVHGPTSRRSPVRLECRWRIGDDSRLVRTWHAVTSPPSQQM
jgi:hypothetical protein